MFLQSKIQIAFMATLFSETLTFVGIITIFHVFVQSLYYANVESALRDLLKYYKLF